MKRIVNWWMDLDPSAQYMYWICAFVAMLGTGVGALILGHELLPDGTFSLSLFSLLAAGIASFVVFFLFVVLFLTVFWPIIRNKLQKGD